MPTLALHVVDLRRRFDGAEPACILQAVLGEVFTRRIAVVSSFGADSGVLLHLVAEIDRATPVGIEVVNGVRLAPEKIRESLLACAQLAPTWVQTCYFALDGEEASQAERSVYLELLESVRGKIKGVHLYGLARPSLQPAASRLSNLSLENFQRFARSVSSIGIEVVANP